MRNAVERLEKRVLMAGHGIGLLHKAPAAPAPSSYDVSAIFATQFVGDPVVESVSLPQFNSALGVLVDTKVLINGKVTTELTIAGENSGYKTNLAASTAVSGPGVLTSDTVLDQVLTVATLTQQTYVRVQSFSETRIVTDSSVLSQYVGAGTVTFNKAISATGFDTIVFGLNGDSGNYQIQESVRKTTDCTITITYDYAPAAAQVFNATGNDAKK